MSNFSLTRQDTLAMKGIAICAMLCHHLYTGADIIGDIVPYTGIMAWIGTLGKVCVAMFLFCSGYGLTAQYEPTKSILDDVRFVLRRLIKFYANYWVIFILFVPITYFLFGRTLTDAYGEHVNVVKRFVYDLLGVQNPAYNVTWWFNKLIIVFYLLFPLMSRLVRIQPLLAIVASMVVSAQFHITGDTMDICTWQLPFVLGMTWQLSESKLPLVQEWLENHRFVFATLTVILLGVFIIMRMYPVISNWNGVCVDGFLSCAIVLCQISFVRRWNYAMLTLAFLGKHSINTYMTHTFFNAYWHPEWLHECEWLRGGGNFVILMLLCLAVSMVLELIKEKLGIYKLVNKIVTRL